jgi:hypothetical protein
LFATGKAIIQNILRHQLIKSDELQRFTIDVGIYPIQEFSATFHDPIKDPDLRNVFRTYHLERLTEVEKNGIR